MTEDSEALSHDVYSATVTRVIDALI